MTEISRNPGLDCGLDIFHCFKCCSNLLHEHSRSPNDLGRQNSQQSLQALNAWAKFTGALAPSERSLDRRLEDGSDLKRAIHGLLHVIRSELYNAFSASDSEETPVLSLRSSPVDVLGNDVIKKKWAAYEGTPWEAVGAAIDALMNVAFLIRSTVPIATSHLDRHYPRDDDVSVFHMIHTLLRRRWPSARQTVREQLAYSTYMRRKRLLYQQTREKKFSESREVVEEVVKDTRKPSHFPTHVQNPQETVALVPIGMASDVPFQRQQNSASTTFSNQENFNLYAKRPPRSTVGSTKSTTARYHRIHKYPSQPKLDQAWLNCPICYRPLESAKFDKAQRYWKEHVDEDVEPFVCLSERCRDPPRFFPRKSKWLDHMQSRHGQNWIQTIHSMTWYCDRDHELEDFDTKERLSEHLKEKHSELNQYRIRALLSTNKRPLEREALRCPICERVPPGLSQQIGNIKKSVTVLLDHIEEDLMGLALFALPIDEPHSENDSVHSETVESSATTADRSSIANLSETFGKNRPPVHAPNEDASSRTSNGEVVVTQELKFPPEIDFQYEPPEEGSDAAWNTYWNMNRGITTTFNETDPVLQALREAKDETHAPLEPALSPNMIESLDVTLRRNMVKSCDPDNSKFLLADRLRDLVTASSVIKELDRSGIRETDHDAAKIASQVVPQNRDADSSTSESRCRIFAVLTLMQKAPAVLQFIEADIFDRHLPFTFPDSPYDFDGPIHSTDIDGSRIAINPRNLFRTNRELWTPATLDRFKTYQWQVLAPFFELSLAPGAKIPHYEFPRKQILPFIEMPEIERRVSGDNLYEALDDRVGQKMVEGSYNVVRKVMIHPAHCNYSAESGREDATCFAVKAIMIYEKTNKVDGKKLGQEAQAFGILNHEHLLQSLATYYYNDRCHMVLPWADGNLYDFWSNSYSDPSNSFNDASQTVHRPALALWVSEQCLGLVRALQCIHEPPLPEVGQGLLIQGHDESYGKHSNLNPHKILWFRDFEAVSDSHGIGTLRISGSAFLKFHAGYEMFTPTYSGPEFDVRKPFSRYSDVWSLGCIFLEFITWYLDGWKGIISFSEKRGEESDQLISADNFFNFTDDRTRNALVASTKASVRKHVESLDTRDECADFVADFLDLIGNDMLRVDPGDRKNCEEIATRFEEMLDNLKDPMYCTERRKPPGRLMRRDSELISVKTAADM